MLKTAIRYYYQIRPLKPVQLYARLRKRLLKPEINAGCPIPDTRPAPATWVQPATMPHDRLDEHRFVMLGEEKALDLPADWHNRDLGKKWLMELHTFNLLWGDNAYCAQELMLDWVSHNEPLQGPGWHQYMTSQRISNWLKWNLAGHTLPAAVRGSLALQARHLMQVLAYDETDHKLFNNGKALLFAACVLDDSDSARWRDKGWQLLQRYGLELVGEDGGYTGLSPMYHCSLLMDMLDIVNLLRAYEQAVPAALDKAVVDARTWLTALCHPDGDIALFNDAALQVTATPAEINQYAVRLGYAPSPPAAQGLLHLADSGFARMAMGPATALLDIGRIAPDHAASHGHADTLTFELSLEKQRVVVDTGLSTYERMPARLQQRGTAAHNTLVLDQRNSSDVWGLFKVGRRASIVESQQDTLDHSLHVSAAHDGYCRPGNKLLHHRRWEMTLDTLSITDRLTGRGSHTAEILYHFHPDISLVQQADNRFALATRERESLCVIELDPALQVEALPYEYHPAFNRAIPATKLRARYQGQLPCSFTCQLHW